MDWVAFISYMVICYGGMCVYCRCYIRREIKRTTLGNFYLNICYGDLIMAIVIAPLSFPAVMVYQVLTKVFLGCEGALRHWGTAADDAHQIENQSVEDFCIDTRKQLNINPYRPYA